MSVSLRVRRSSTDNKLLSALSRCEPEPLLALADAPSSSSSPSESNSSYLYFRTVSTLSDFYDRELVATIGWAKQIPGEKANSFISTGLIVVRGRKGALNYPLHFLRVLVERIAFGKISLPIAFLCCGVM